MSVAQAQRKGYEIQLKLQGQTVFVHKNFGTVQMESFEVRSLKEMAKNDRRQVVFRFPDQIDAYPDDVIQIQGSRDYWKIVDTEDHIEDDVYFYMEAWVQKINELGGNVRLNENGKAIFTGNNYGVLQMGGQGNSQSVIVTHNINPDFTEAIKDLAGLVRSSSLSELDKEERLADIDRIKQLSQKEQTPEVIALAKSKINLLETGLKVADVTLKAGPLISTLSGFFSG